MATDVATSLAQLDLLPGSTITVTVDAAGAAISSMSIHGWQSDPEETLVAPSPVAGAYIYGGEVA